MNKREIIPKIIIAVFLIMSLSTMFLSYTGLREKDLVKALKDNFSEFDKAIDEIEDKLTDNDEEIVLLESTSGLKTLDKIADFDASEHIKEVKRLRTFTMTAMIVSWSALFISLVLIIVLKKKTKYIMSAVFSLIGTLSMWSISFFIPDMVRDTIIALTDKEISESKTWVATLLMFLKGKIGVKIAEFAHDVLMKTLNYGYWLCIAFSGMAFLISIVCLIVSCLRKKETSKISARLIGLRGMYEGADIDIGQMIIIGRDPSVSQLVISKPNISRKHCKIEFNENTGKYIVTDYSSNGTYIHQKIKNT